MIITPMKENFLYDEISPIVVASGGIGNQLFQYCLALAIGKRTETVPYLDFTLLALSHKSGNQRPTIRSLPLAKIKIASRASNFETLFANNSRRFSKTISRRYIHTLEQDARNNSYKVFKQSALIWDRSIHPEIRSLYIGSFTSFQYWKEHFHQFTQSIQGFLNSYSLELGFIDQAEGSEVVIHARRGDYSKNSKTRRLHGVYGLEYYISAFSKYYNRQYKTLAILSDDPRFAKSLAKELRAQFPSIYTTVSKVSNPLFLLQSYSNCQLFIGSNSTFSWWLANLGVDKIRVLPLKWFDQGEYGFDSKAHFPLDTELLPFPFETRQP
jgi:hypothetical protein